MHRAEQEQDDDQGRQVERARELDESDLAHAVPPPLLDQLPRQWFVHVKGMEDRVHASALEAAQVPFFKASHRYP